MATLLFLDTNVFLHYQDFDSLPWKTLCKDSVTIVIPPITIRELNKHKDTLSRPRIRRRAEVALKKIANLLGASLTTQVNEDVELIFESRDPLISFSENQLSPEVNDDQLIASILMAKDESPNATTILVTSDTGLTLRTKAQRLAIQTMMLSDEYKLPEEPDPEQARIRELETEIRELKATQPKLSVIFEDEHQHTVLALGPLVVPDPDIEDEALRELREQHPKLTPPQSNESENLTTPRSAASLMRGFNLSNSISPEDIKKYNVQLEKFYEEYSRYLQKDLQHRELKSRSGKIQLWLLNSGTAPAEDIDVFLHFPDGFQLAPRLPDAPKPPSPPAKPLTELEKLTRPAGRVFDPMFLTPPRPVPNLRPSPEPNVSSPRIKRTNSYDVSYEVRYVKHGIRVLLSELFVIFDSLESAHSFQIHCEILAANVPQKVAGELHVVVKEAQTDGQG